MNAPMRRDTVFTHTFPQRVLRQPDGRVVHPDTILRVGVKDLIDVAGSITTAGSQAVERLATPAPTDAPLLRGIRAAELLGAAHVVGKTNLHELAYGGDGINRWFGTPPNPLDARRVPGGSSSGSASAIGFGRVDAAVGSDTGGSIRIPAACCGVVGLKPTWGVVPTQGVWGLAPTLDTVGPMASDTASLVRLADMLIPGLADEVRRVAPAQQVAVLSTPDGAPCDPMIELAVGTALRTAEIAVYTVGASWWAPAVDHGLTALVGEAYRNLSWLLDHDAFLEPRIANRIRLGAGISDSQLDAARSFRTTAAEAIAATCSRHQLIATPTLPMLPPLIDEQAGFAPYTTYTRPANIAGTPAIAIPIPLVDPPSHLAHLRTSLQLMGPKGSEALLIATAKRIEAAVSR